MQDLEGQACTDAATPAATSPERDVQYRCESTGATWSGRGQKPKWIQVHLEGGGSLDDLLVKPIGLNDSDGGLYDRAVD